MLCSSKQDIKSFGGLTVSAKYNGINILKSIIINSLNYIFKAWLVSVKPKVFRIAYCIALRTNTKGTTARTFVGNIDICSTTECINYICHSVIFLLENLFYILYNNSVLFHIGKIYNILGYRYEKIYGNIQLL